MWNVREVDGIVKYPSRVRVGSSLLAFGLAVGKLSESGLCSTGGDVSYSSES